MSSGLLIGLYWMAVNRGGTVAFTVHGPLEREDLAGLYDRICTLLENSAALVAVCDVDGVAADAVSADALARLALAARRRGAQISLRGASPALRALIDFMGLTNVLPEAPAMPPGGEADRTAAAAARARGRT